jgi:hypothetical protein
VNTWWWGEGHYVRGGEEEQVEGRLAHLELLAVSLAQAVVVHLRRLYSCAREFFGVVRDILCTYTYTALLYTYFHLF